MPKDTILLNQLYVGNYLEDEAHIGHEIINLIKADDGNNYIYVTSTGIVTSPRKIESIIFVRNLYKRTTAEVIAVATGPEVFQGSTSDVLYKGVPYSRIFGDAPITFKAGKVIIPADEKRIFITMDADSKLDDTSDNFRVLHLKPNRQALFGQKMRGYFPEDKETSTYKDLLTLINDESLWEAQTATAQDLKRPNAKPSFLQFIGKIHSEHIYSNLFAQYFQNNKQGFRLFAKEVLGMPDMSTDFTVERETEDHIDIWVEDAKHIIVIENKINSGINGIKPDGTTQLDKYVKAAKSKVKPGQKCYFYIFAPRYNKVFLEDYVQKSAYKLVSYDELYDFFLTHEVEFTNEFYPEFLADLKFQNKSLDEQNQDMICTRFLNMIEQAKQA